MVHLTLTMATALLASHVAVGIRMENADPLDAKSCFCKSNPNHIGTGKYAKDNWSTKGPGGGSCPASTSCKECRRHGEACCEAKTNGNKGACGVLIKAETTDAFGGAKCICQGYTMFKSQLAEKYQRCSPDSTCNQCYRMCIDKR